MVFWSQKPPFGNSKKIRCTTQPKQEFYLNTMISLEKSLWRWCFQELYGYDVILMKPAREVRPITTLSSCDNVSIVYYVSVLSCALTPDET